MKHHKVEKSHVTLSQHLLGKSTPSALRRGNLLKENGSLLFREMCLGGHRDQEAITAKVRMVERRQGAGEGRAQVPGPCAAPRAAPVPSPPMLL